MGAPPPGQTEAEGPTSHRKLPFGLLGSSGLQPARHHCTNNACRTKELTWRKTVKNGPSPAGQEGAGRRMGWLPWAAVGWRPGQLTRGALATRRGSQGCTAVHCCALLAAAGRYPRNPEGEVGVALRVTGGLAICWAAGRPGSGLARRGGAPVFTHSDAHYDALTALPGRGTPHRQRTDNTLARALWPRRTLSTALSAPWPTARLVAAHLLMPRPTRAPPRRRRQWPRRAPRRRRGARTATLSDDDDGEVLRGRARRCDRARAR